MAHITVIHEMVILFCLCAVRLATCADLRSIVVNGTGISVLITNGTPFRVARVLFLTLSDMLRMLIIRVLAARLTRYVNQSDRRLADSGRNVIVGCAACVIRAFRHVNDLMIL